MNSEDLTQVLMLVYQVLLPSELSSLAFKMGDVAQDSPVSRGTLPSGPCCLVWEDCELSSQLFVLLNTHAWKSSVKTSPGLAGAAAARMF